MWTVAGTRKTLSPRRLAPSAWSSSSLVSATATMPRAVQSDPLSEVILELGHEGSLIVPVLGVDLGDGADGYGEQVVHSPSVAPGIRVFQDTARQTAGPVEEIDERANEHDRNDSEHTFAFKGHREVGTKLAHFGHVSRRPHRISQACSARPEVFGRFVQSACVASSAGTFFHSEEER